MTHTPAIAIAFVLYGVLTAWVWCRLTATISREQRLRDSAVDASLTDREKLVRTQDSLDKAVLRAKEASRQCFAVEGARKGLEAAHEALRGESRDLRTALDAAAARIREGALQSLATDGQAMEALERADRAERELARLSADPLIQRREAMRTGKAKRNATGQVLSERSGHPHDGQEAA